MTTREIAERCGVSQSLVKQLALDGVIAPAVQGYGRGSAIEWDEHSVAQVEAYKRIRRWLGDGALARAAITRLKTVRAGASELAAPPTAGIRGELSLTEA